MSELKIEELKNTDLDLSDIEDSSEDEAISSDNSDNSDNSDKAVSYTHLTLPTILLV